MPAKNNTTPAEKPEQKKAEDNKGSEQKDVDKEPVAKKSRKERVPCELCEFNKMSTMKRLNKVEIIYTRRTPEELVVYDAEQKALKEAKDADDE